MTNKKKNVIRLISLEDKINRINNSTEINSSINP
ncbi:hypothetical protein FPHOBKDP_00045 [Listeria phage LPJP1]|nr:hypothetical protein FPHOBKDP_00045 [Listeria phage LPJP1]